MRMLMERSFAYPRSRTLHAFMAWQTLEHHQGSLLRAGHNPKGIIMLGWAVTFLIVALLAAILGFTGLAGTAAGIAKILFAIFLILFVISLIVGRGRRSAR